MPIRVTQTRAPAAGDVNYACARVGFVATNNPNDLMAKATAAGFTHVGGNQYTHTDGSWIYMDASGRVQRGAGGVQFQGIPGGRTAQAQQAQPAAATFQQGGTAQYDNSRPGVPASMRAYKIAQIGIVNSANVASTCASHGYVQSGSMWVHADGSWASVSGGRVSVGWKGYSLQELPYRNQGGWR
jgi:hypothetical protein